MVSFWFSCKTTKPTSTKSKQTRKGCNAFCSPNMLVLPLFVRFLWYSSFRSTKTSQRIAGDLTTGRPVAPHAFGSPTRSRASMGTSWCRGPKAGRLSSKFWCNRRAREKRDITRRKGLHLFLPGPLGTGKVFGPKAERIVGVRGCTPREEFCFTHPAPSRKEKKPVVSF